MSIQIEQVTRRQLAAFIDDLGFEGYEKNAFERLMQYGAPLWVGYIDGQLVCFWGLKPTTLLSNEAYLWLHTRPELKGHEFVFIRQSQIVIKKMLKSYPIIHGHTFEDQPQSIKWLRILGARFRKIGEGVLAFTIGGE